MKYELLDKDSETGLHRIRALRDIPRYGVRAGDEGGLIGSEANLSQDGSAWVTGSAQVYESAWVTGSAQVYGSALVRGSALVYGSAQVRGSALVYGSAQVYGEARVYGSALVSGSAQVSHDRDWVLLGPVGSDGRFVTATRTATGSQIVAGCWTGTSTELRERVAHPKKRWPEASKADRRRWAREYRALCDLVDARKWSS